MAVGTGVVFTTLGLQRFVGAGNGSGVAAGEQTGCGEENGEQNGLDNVFHGIASKVEMDGHNG